MSDLSIQDIVGWLRHLGDPTNVPPPTETMAPPPDPDAVVASPPVDGTDVPPPAVPTLPHGIADMPVPTPQVPPVSTLLPGTGVPDDLARRVLNLPQSPRAPLSVTGGAPAQVTPPAPAQPRSDVPVTPGPVTRPDVPTFQVPPEVAPPPNDPFQVPTWRRTVDYATGQSDLDLQRQKSELSQQEARVKADELTRQASIEEQAQRESKDRVDRYRAMQDRAADDLHRRTQALLAAATDVSDLYPRRETAGQAMGQALLALSAGLGSSVAASILQKDAQENHDWTEMSVKRHESLVNGLRAATEASQSEFNGYGQAGVQEADMDRSLTLARKEAFAKELEAKVAQFAPGQAKIDGMAAVDKLRRDISKQYDDDSTSMVNSYLQHVKLVQMLNPVHGVPGAPPAEPQWKEGMNREEFERQHAYWQSVEMPQWTAKMGAAGTGGGAVPRPPWESGGKGGTPTVGPGGRPAGGPAAPSAGAPASTGKLRQQEQVVASVAKAMGLDPVKAREVALKLGLIDPWVGAEPKSPAPPPSSKPGTPPAEPPMSPADKVLDQQYGITFRSGRLRIARGQVPVLNQTQTVDLRNDVSKSDESLRAVEALAQLELLTDTNAKDVIQRNPYLGGLLKQVGGNVESVNKATADSMRHLLVAKIASDVKERSRISQENFAGALPEEAWFGGGNADKVKGSLGAVIDFMTGDTVAKLRGSNYDAKPLEDSVRDTKTVINGIGNKPGTLPPGGTTNDPKVARDQAEGQRTEDVGRNREDEISRDRGIVLDYHLNRRADYPHDVHVVPGSATTQDPTGTVKNDAPDGPWRNEYNVIAKQQLSANEALRRFHDAFVAQDWIAAEHARQEVEVAREQQAQATQNLIHSLPHKAYRDLARSYPKSVNADGTWIPRDWYSQQRFIGALLDSDGAILKGYR